MAEKSENYKVIPLISSYAFQFPISYFSHRRMQGWMILKQYFDNNNTESLSILTDKTNIKQMLQDTTLVLFLRYLENLHQSDIETSFKTLMLLTSFLRLNCRKICNLLPFKQIQASELHKQKIDEFHMFLLQKIVEYVNYLISDHHFDKNWGDQLELLTKSLLKIYHFIEYKSQSLSKYAKLYYWMVQERLYEFWLKINQNITDFQHLQKDKFKAFYEDYCNFWKYKRKIPKITHRNLKSIEPSASQNDKIQERSKKLPYQEENTKETYFEASRLENMFRMINCSQWDD